MGGKTSTSTSQVQIPPDVLARYNSVNATAEQVAQTPFQQYSTNPNAFVQPLTPTQQAGEANTNAAAGMAQPYFNAASGFALAGANPVNAQPLDTSAYMNPYLNTVLGSTANLINQNNQMAMAGQTGNAINQGYFGGDRSGIAAAVLQGQQNLAAGQVYSGIASDAYNQALAAAQQQQGVGLGAAQANRAALQQTGATLAGLGTGAQGAALEGAQAQLAAGQVEQQTGQAGLTALYNQFLQQQSYPFQTAQFLANIAEGTGALSGSTTTTTQPQSIFSDERLKEDIEPIGKGFDGANIIRFRYRGDPTTRIGMSAQEVEERHPEAVSEHGGFKAVDYGRATDDAAQRGGFALAANDNAGDEPRRARQYGGFGGPPAPSTVPGWQIAQLLQAQAEMYAPFKEAGLYGGSASGVPHGGAGYVPPSEGPRAFLPPAAPAFQHQDTALQDVTNLADTGTKLSDFAKSDLGKGIGRNIHRAVDYARDVTGHANLGSNVQSQVDDLPRAAPPPDPTPQESDAPTVTTDESGNLTSGQAHGGFVRAARQDGGDINPYGGYGGLSIPTGGGSSAPRQLQTPGAPGQGPSALHQLGTAAHDVSNIATVGEDVGKGIDWLKNLSSGVPFAEGGFVRAARDSGGLTPPAPGKDKDDGGGALSGFVSHLPQPWQAEAGALENMPLPRALGLADGGDVSNDDPYKPQGPDLNIPTESPKPQQLPTAKPVGGQGDSTLHQAGQAAGDIASIAKLAMMFAARGGRIGRQDGGDTPDDDSVDASGNPVSSSGAQNLAGLVGRTLSGAADRAVQGAGRMASDLAPHLSAAPNTATLKPDQRSQMQTMDTVDQMQTAMARAKAEHPTPPPGGFTSKPYNAPEPGSLAGGMWAGAGPAPAGMFVTQRGSPPSSTAAPSAPAAAPAGNSSVIPPAFAAALKARQRAAGAGDNPQAAVTRAHHAGRGAGAQQAQAESAAGPPPQESSPAEIANWKPATALQEEQQHPQWVTPQIIAKAAGAREQPLVQAPGFGGAAPSVSNTSTSSGGDSGGLTADASGNVSYQPPSGFANAAPPPSADASAPDTALTPHAVQHAGQAPPPTTDAQGNPVAPGTVQHDLPGGFYGAGPGAGAGAAQHQGGFGGMLQGIEHVLGGLGGGLLHLAGYEGNGQWNMDRLIPILNAIGVAGSVPTVHPFVALAAGLRGYGQGYMQQKQQEAELTSNQAMIQHTLNADLPEYQQGLLTWRPGRAAPGSNQREQTYNNQPWHLEPVTDQLQSLGGGGGGGGGGPTGAGGGGGGAAPAAAGAPQHALTANYGPGGGYNVVPTSSTQGYMSGLYPHGQINYDPSRGPQYNWAVTRANDPQAASDEAYARKQANDLEGDPNMNDFIQRNNVFLGTTLAGLPDSGPLASGPGHEAITNAAAWANQVFSRVLGIPMPKEISEAIVNAKSGDEIVDKLNGFLSQMTPAQYGIHAAAEANIIRQILPGAGTTKQAAMKMLAHIMVQTQASRDYAQFRPQFSGIYGSDINSVQAFRHEMGAQHDREEQLLPRMMTRGAKGGPSVIETFLNHPESARTLEQGWDDAQGHHDGVGEGGGRYAIFGQQ